LVDLSGDAEQLARYRAAIESRATLELAFEPHAGAVPRIWRIRAR
jgi:hypothetical protein